MPYDLHTHSLASDGTRTPADVIALAADAGLAGLALVVLMASVGSRLFWAEWVSLVVIAVHYILASSTWDGYEAPA